MMTEMMNTNNTTISANAAIRGIKDLHAKIDQNERDIVLAEVEIEELRENYSKDNKKSIKKLERRIKTLEREIESYREEIHSLKKISRDYKRSDDLLEFATSEEE